MSGRATPGAGRPLRPVWTGPLGLHQPGTSLLHRAPAAAKLVGLAVAGLVVVLVHGPQSALAALTVAIGAHTVARLAWHRTRRGLAGTAVVALVIGGYQTWARGWEVGVETAAVLVQAALESRDAARARGLERSPRAVVVPAAVRMVGHARATGEALAARGLGEDHA